MTVRNVDDKIVRALKLQADRNGISMEAEHRNLLADALLTPRIRSFTEVIQSIPPVGHDKDFSLPQDELPSRAFT